MFKNGVIVFTPISEQIIIKREFMGVNLITERFLFWPSNYRRGIKAKITDLNSFLFYLPFEKIDEFYYWNGIVFA